MRRSNANRNDLAIFWLTFCLLMVALSRVALGEDFASAMGGAGGKPKAASSNNSSSPGSKANDKKYNNKIKSIEEGYNKQTAAVNSGKYEDYLSQLDKTYEAQVSDINNGGTGKAGELPKFKPDKVPGDTTSIVAGSGDAAGAAATGAAGGEAKETAKSDNPMLNAILSTCPEACGGGGAMGHSCMSDCAKGVAFSGPQAAGKNDSGMMMALMLMMTGGGQ